MTIHPGYIIAAVGLVGAGLFLVLLVAYQLGRIARALADGAYQAGRLALAAEGIRVSVRLIESHAALVAAEGPTALGKLAESTVRTEEEIRAIALAVDDAAERIMGDDDDPAEGGADPNNWTARVTTTPLSEVIDVVADGRKYSVPVDRWDDMMRDSPGT